MAAACNSRRPLAVAYASASPKLLLLLHVFVLSIVCVLGDPVTVPDFSRCGIATDKAPVGDPTVYNFNCCLPVVPPHKVVQFSHSAYKLPYTRMRYPAHKVGPDYVAKYERAYAIMRSLPDTDPRSLKVQADLHCAFCNGAYNQTSGSASAPLQVHFSWLFLPWHRLYLYFHERILASLIGDPTFSLVYWNWDDQLDGGNVFPSMFARNASSLYDEKRNPNITATLLVRLSATSSATNDTVVADENVNGMYQALVTARTADLFAGGPYRIGSDLTNATVINAPLGGSIENTVHNGIHYWTGSGRSRPLGQDMGTFTTASRDPVFYAHHSNVDRLWDMWRFHLPGGERLDHVDPDFLDAEFAFYDEYANLVKVKVRDSLDISKLNYKYKRVSTDKQWIDYQPRPASNGSALAAARAKGVPVVAASPANGTISLGQRLVGIVQRPRALNLRMPEHADEVLEIQGVTVVRDSFVQLVVFVNLPDAVNTTATNTAEFVGVFNIVPTASPHRRLVTNLRFEIGDNIKRVGLKEDDYVVITIVVKGQEAVTIEGMRVVYN